MSQSHIFVSFPDVSSGVVGKCAMNYKLSCVHVYNNVRRYAWNFRYTPLPHFSTKKIILDILFCNSFFRIFAINY